MRRSIPPVALVGLCVAALAVTDGSAQTSEGRSIVLFQDVSKEANTFIDNAPRSPVSNPESRRFRLSPGDVVVARTPVLDRRGGKRVGTVHATASVVSGTQFQNALLEAQAVLALGDGTIVLAGLAGATETPLAVVGGTGAYEGATGSATEKETDDGAELTIRLVP